MKISGYAVYGTCTIVVWIARLAKLGVLLTASLDQLQ